MTRLLAVWVGLTAGAALAESPTVVAFPVAVHDAPSIAAARAVQKGFRQLLAQEPNVATPTPSAWDAAVSTLKRQDCETNDDCLRELAVTAGALYAIHVEVEQDLTKKDVVALGRIVRRDGVLIPVGEQRVLRVQLTRGPDSFEAVAKVALARMLGMMNLGGLPSTLPSAEQAVKPAETADAGTPQVAVVETPDAGIPPSPPPLVIETPGPSRGRITSYALGAGGVVAAAIGTGLVVSAMSDKSALNVDGSGSVGVPYTPDAAAKVRSANTNATAGTIALVGGGALVAAAVVLFFMSPAVDEPPPAARMSLAPVPGGAVVGFSMEFP